MCIFEPLFDQSIAQSLKNVNALEKAILSFLPWGGLGWHLEQEDQKLSPCCPSCGSEQIEAKGKEQRMLKTQFGEVHFSRRRALCQQCGRNFYPLDEELGRG